MTPLPNPPTVRAMGRMALPLGSALVAGGLGVGRPVRWARTSGVLSPLFPVLNADEAALLDLPLVQSSNPALTLERVVRELGRLGVAAILVKGEVSPVARREAERSNLPLYLLPADSDLSRVARAIIRLVTDREVQEEAQAAALYRHLTQQVALGVGLEALVAELHRLTGHAVRLADLSDGLLAGHGSAPPASATLSRPLFVGDSPTAMLALRDSEEALDDFARIALEQGAAALALELAKREAVEAAREGLYGNLVATLLLGEEDSVLAARARAADFPLEATQWVILAATEQGRAAEEALAGWLRRAVTRAEALGWQGRSHLSEGNFPTLGRGWQGTLLLAGGPSLWESSRSDFVAHLQQTAPARLSLAAGEPGRGLEGLRRAHAQANDALGLGLRLLGAGRSFLHRDLGLYRLLRHLHSTDDLHQFLDSTLAALEQYDAEHSSALIETLRALLAEGGNVSATAKAMHLHRNSLVYRLERIREIAALDPTNPDDAFTLRLALMLAPLR